MADAIVSVVLERLAAILEEKIRGEVGLLRGVKEEVASLSRMLETVRNLLEDAERRGVRDESMKGWLKKLKDTAYEMDDILDEWNYHAIHASLKAEAKAKVRFPFIQSSRFPFKKVVVRRGISKKIKNVKASLAEILKEKNEFNFSTIMPPADSTPQPETLPTIDVEKVVGEEVERKKKDIVGRLMMDGDKNQVLGIVGMGGIGKTTLAQLVYNDIQVKDCFKLRIWICVSDPFDMVGIARGIIEYVESKIDSDITGVILQKLQDCISGKKFLLVLDDVWIEDYNKWEPLIVSLRCGAATSKILVTTRKDSVAQMMGIFEDRIFRPKLLKDDECWSLLRRTSFRGKTERRDFEGVGKELAKKCKGLPLAVNILGNVLHSKNSLDEWKSVLDSEIWKLDETEVQLYPHLLLSYRELSPQLKLCFSYCSVYPKDTRIKVESLIRHWMALGYLDSVTGNGGMGMELKGRDYFTKLAKRSLFQDFEKDDYTEQISSCKMHDIVHDFAQSLGNNGVKTCQVCNNVLDSHVQAYRTVSWEKLSPQGFCNCLASLRVLKRYNAYFLFERSLHGIEKLIHLRWLDVSMTIRVSEKDMKTICKLYYLQTLLLASCFLEEIPREIENLIYLSHIDLSENKSLKVLPEETYSLIKLQTLKLRECSLREISAKIENLVELRHLDLSRNKELEVLPRNITKLIRLHTLLLSRCSLKEIPNDIGNLINLRRLDLNSNGEIKELPESICGMVELQTLAIRECEKLRRLPQGLASLYGLRQLDWFIGGSGFSRVRLLKNLNSLGGNLKLCISVTSDSIKGLVEDVRETELKKKVRIEELNIIFKSINERNDRRGCSSPSPSLWVDLIEALEPHQNLRFLTIFGYMGSRLPNWLSSPHNQIRTIQLFDCNELSSLPPMGKLPFLEKLVISGMKKLKVLGVEWLGIRGRKGDAMNIQSSSSLVTFPKLTELKICYCGNWSKWRDITAKEEKSSAISVMPCLKTLNLTSIEVLNVLPHRLLRKLLSLENLIVTQTTRLQRYGDKNGSAWRSISQNNPKLRITLDVYPYVG